MIQIVCQLMVLLVCSLTYLFRLDPSECLGKELLLVGRNESVGHREKNVILFLDVLTQEDDVSRQVVADCINSFCRSTLCLWSSHRLSL